MNTDNLIFIISIVSVELILHSCVPTEKTINQDATKPPNMTIHEETKPIEITPIVLELREGQKLGRIGMGVLCIPMTDLKSIEGKAGVSENDFTDVVRTVLEDANYNIAENSSVNSQRITGDDELILRGTVKDLKANACFPKSGFRSWKISKGESRVKLYWQIYSKKSDEILFETTTEGSEKLSEAIGYGITKVIIRSVAVATRNLIADKRFNMVVTNSIN
ncbi:MAG: hypothetical protein WBD99_12795 [Thermodesulfobacteriota bacterium]